MKLDIFECQPGIFCRPTGASCYADPYIYHGPTADGLHCFTQGTKRELFAKRKAAPAGWHLKRGAFTYEFCRSVA
jgi:hypothetical protein